MKKETTKTKSEMKLYSEKEDRESPRWREAVKENKRTADPIKQGKNKN